jgi:uncharacterized membrane protein
MRNPRTRLIIVALAWLLGLAALPFLPGRAPIHWNAAGEADGFGSPLTAALLLPAILTGIAVLAPLLPRLDPRGEAYAAFRPTYELFLNAVAGFMLLVHMMALGAALGLPVDMVRPMSVGLGLLFALLGNEMGRVQPNYFVGIRTPWTLADPEVWRRTHRAGGRAMVGAGLAAALLGLLLPAPWPLYAGLALVLGATLYALGYSYIVFRQLKGGQAR